jgi:hypothetical protein
MQARRSAYSAMRFRAAPAGAEAHRGPSRLSVFAIDRRDQADLITEQRQ